MCVEDELVDKIVELAMKEAELAAVMVKLIEATRELIYEFKKRKKPETVIPATAQPVREMILGVMEPGKAYTPVDIKRLIREKYGTEILYSTLHITIHTLTRKGVLKKLKRGVYQLAP